MMQLLFTVHISSFAQMRSLGEDINHSLIYSLGSVGKVLMSLDKREWTALNTLVFPQVMQAAMPRCRGLKCARMAGGCSTDRRKLRISSPVQMLEKFAWFGCSWKTRERYAEWWGTEEPTLVQRFEVGKMYYCFGEKSFMPAKNKFDQKYSKIAI